MYLTIELPTVYNTEDIGPYSILLFAEEDNVPLNNITDRLITTNIESTIQSSVNSYPSANIQTNYFIDPELGLDNLCELKHHMLTRNARANNIDRRLQPNSSTRNTLEIIINVNFSFIFLDCF